MSYDKPTFEFACTRVTETDQAVLVKEPASGEEIWFPLSAVQSMHFDRRGEGTMIVDEWVARKKGLC